MTDHRSDDDLVSAVIDGEATPAEVARVEGDPALAARAEELRAAATAIGQPVAGLDDDLVAALVGRALTEHDAVRGASNASPAPVVGLERRRPSARWLAAAAAVLVVLGLPLVLVLSQRQDDRSSFQEVGAAVDDGEATATAGAESDAIRPAAPDAASELSDAVPAPSTTMVARAPSATASAMPIDLGDLGPLGPPPAAQAADAVGPLLASGDQPAAGLDAGSSAQEAPTTGPTVPCPDAVDPTATLLATATARLDGVGATPVVVLVVARPDGATTTAPTVVLVLRAADCAPVGEAPLLP